MAQLLSNAERCNIAIQHPIVCSAIKMYEVLIHAKTAGKHVKEPDLKVKYHAHHSCHILEALWIERVLSGSEGTEATSYKRVTEIKCISQN